MLIIFGSISIELTIKTPATATKSDPIKAFSYTKEPGGKAANQALAAARTGAKSALVGMVGEDEYGTHILSKLRHEGITTSGVGKSKDYSTGLIIKEIDENQNTRHTIVSEANNLVDTDQIPDEILNEGTVILTQTEIDSSQNIEILKRAKAAGATTILNLSPNLDLTQSILNHLDYMIVNKPEAEILAKKLGMQSDQNTVKLAQALSHAGKMSCIITMGKDGAVGVDKTGHSWIVGTLKDLDIIDPTGAEDAFCGTFAASIYAQLPLPEALKNASVAATLTCTKEGCQKSYPYSADIEEHLEKLDDAKECPIELFKN